MKTLSKIRLTQLGKDELQTREMNAVRGGVKCSCFCIGVCECSVSWMYASSVEWDGYDAQGILESESHWNGFNNGCESNY